MSTLIARDETIDCSNPKLDIFIDLDGILVDVEALEFAIFDIDDPMVPVQTFPVAGFQALDPANSCPVGQKISVGRYTAVWVVPSAEPLTDHKITWRFRLNAGDPFQEDEFTFNVVTVAGSQDPADVAAFRKRFPDFADAMQWPANLISCVLGEASEELDPNCFGTDLEKAKRYYAAHLLSYPTGGARAKGASSVAAGPANISWDTAKENLAATAYGQQLRRLMRMCTGGQVVC